MNHASNAQKGASLIEVLVSILVISLGILAMVVMQLNTTKYAKTSEYRAMGAMLASDLADRMRANRAQNGEVAASYQYTTKYPPSQPPTAGTGCYTTDPCTPQNMANKDIADWRTSVFNSLPQGDAFISGRDATGIDLWLIWQEPGTTAEGGTSLEPTGTTDCPASIIGSTTIVPRCMHFRITDI